MIEKLLIEMFLPVVIVLNLCALLIGIIMLLAPQWLAPLSRWGNQWLSFRKLTKPLDVMRGRDDVPMHYPNIFGLAIIIASGYILIQSGRLLIGTDAFTGGRVLANIFISLSLPSPIWESLWLTLLILTLLGAMLSMLVGLLSLFSRDRLRRLSQFSDRWISTRRLLRPLDAVYSWVDDQVLKRIRLWGVMICFLALFTVVMLMHITASL